MVGITNWADTIGATQNIVIDTTTITLPFEHNGIDEAWFCIEGIPTNLNSWGMDTLLINNVECKNSYLHSYSFPERINEKFYIYYKGSVDWAHFEINGSNEIYSDKIDSVYIDTITYTFTGIGKKMFIVEHEINYINSWLADSVSINNVDIKNRYIAVMPEPINNNYYIYFESSSVDASINISMTEQALPIELQSYNHHIEDNAVHLEWTTATEIESSRFLIKRNSELIGEIDAHGTTTSEHNYSWQDIDPPEGELKYEIFEVSYSGNIVSIFTINLNYQSIDQLKLNLYPNPVNTAINIALETNREKNVKIKMYDILGKIVKESDVSLSIGNNVIKLDLSSLATGIYSVVINNSINKKIVVLK